MVGVDGLIFSKNRMRIWMIFNDGNHPQMACLISALVRLVSSKNSARIIPPDRKVRLVTMIIIHLIYVYMYVCVYIYIYIYIYICIHTYIHIYIYTGRYLGGPGGIDTFHKLLMKTSLKKRYRFSIPARRLVWFNLGDEHA